VLQQLGNQPNLGQAAGQLSAAVSQGTSAGQNLINAIDQRCPGGLPTVSPTGTASATA